MNIDGNITPWFVIGTAITYLVQLILAYGVYYEAERIKRVEQKLCVEDSCVKRDFWQLLLSLYHMAEFPTLQQITKCFVFLVQSIQD